MTTDTTCINCTGICSYNLVVFCNLIAFAMKASSKVNEYVLFWTGINLLLAGRELLVALFIRGVMFQPYPAGCGLLWIIRHTCQMFEIWDAEVYLAKKKAS